MSVTLFADLLAVVLTTGAIAFTLTILAYERKMKMKRLMALCGVWIVFALLGLLLWFAV